VNASSISSLRVSKVVRASPERLFRAWTDPKQLAQWWHLQGEGWTFMEATVDLREGGGYRLAMSGPDGKAYVAVGEYREIRRPSRLTFSWHWVTTAGRGPETLVTIDFNAAGETETEVVLVHSRIADPKTSTGFQSGWCQLLALLADYLGSNNRDD
jgi:uncharacterized protein YndB with AHSA1/START domain